MAKPARFLFICKAQHSYGPYTFSTGLWQSATFIADMLTRNGYFAKVVVVIDNNDIDRVVSQYQPTHAFIEALWVVPEKFAQLIPLHPTVKWFIRVHSNTPFIAQEGIAMDWLSRYLDFGPQMNIDANGREMFESLDFFLTARYALVRDNFGHRVDVDKHLTYLPNFYPVTPVCDLPDHPHTQHVDVGCFGAVRVLKDQLIQAVAAIQFAEDIGKNLRFHINVGRIEGGNQVLKNIRGLFLNQLRHELVEHDWLPHNAFIELVRSMDIGMQVSFSETFNICAADFADQLVPIVVSDQIPWANGLFVTDTTSSEAIVRKMKTVWRERWFGIAHLNKRSLAQFCADSERRWVHFAEES
jgi:hypothetical protein